MFEAHCNCYAHTCEPGMPITKTASLPAQSVSDLSMEGDPCKSTLELELALPLAPLELQPSVEIKQSVPTESLRTGRSEVSKKVRVARAGAV